MLKPKGRGIALRTLRFAEEVRDPEACFSGIRDVEIRKDALKLAEGAIDERVQDWKPAPEVEESGKVINIMDALRRSLEEGKRARR